LLILARSAWATAPNLTISDARVTEGNSGTVDLVFTATLSTATFTKVTAGYATGGGTATATADYTPKQGTLTIPAWQRSTTVRVPVVGDTIAEPDETVELQLSNAVGATITDGTGVGTIVNDDTAPPPPPTTRTLTVSKTGVGVGRVTSQPLGINCPTDCTESYASGTTVTLSAYPDSASTFAGWTGACSGMGACTVTMDADRTVGAAFADTQPATKSLQIWIDGWGSGTITSSPAGINCNSQSGGCSAPFATGSTVTLTATPDAGSQFNGFLDCSSTGSPCTVTMTDNKTVWSQFCPIDDFCSAG
jgi:hypothetical protein